MNHVKCVAEAAASYGLTVADIQGPIMPEQEGLPLEVVISFEEYQKLRGLVADEEMRQRSGWAGLELLLKEVHRLPTDHTAEETEAEIGAARCEVSEGGERSAPDGGRLAARDEER